MRKASIFVGAAAVIACAGLSACGKYGPRGDRGLPPAPEYVAYPNLNRAPPDDRRRLKGPAEQARLKADLLARKPPPRSRR